MFSHAIEIPDPLTGPDKAAARLEAMPDRWRVMALQGIDSVQSRRAYAMLVRRYFPEQDRIAEFSRMASAVRYLEGSDAVAKLLEAIAATPAERERILEPASGSPGGQGAAGQR